MTNETVFILIVLISAIVGIGIALKGWAYWRNRGIEAADAAKARVQEALDKTDLDEEFATAWSDVDGFVDNSRKWRKHFIGKDADIELQMYTACGIVTSTIIASTAYNGGATLASGLAFALLLAIIPASTQVLQAVISLSGDRGIRPGLQFNGVDRSRASWIMLFSLLLLNFIFNLVGSLTIGATITTQAAISSANTSSLLTEQANIERRIRDAEALVAKHGEPEAIAARFKAARDEWICESYLGNGVRTCPADKVQAGEPGRNCGTQCKEKRAAAAELKQLAESTGKLPALKARSEDIKQALANNGDTREDANPAGAAVEAITGGVVEARTFSNWFLFVVLFFVSIVDFGTWLKAGSILGALLHKSYVQAAERGNETLKRRRQAPRYMVEPPQTALPAPTMAGDVTIEVTQDPTAVIAASENLTEIDKMFKDLLRAKDGESVEYGTLYAIYAERKEQDRIDRYLPDVTFFAALSRYCELMKIKHAGSIVYGYRLGVASAPAAAAE